MKRWSIKELEHLESESEVKSHVKKGCDQWETSNTEKQVTTNMAGPP